MLLGTALYSLVLDTDAIIWNLYLFSFWLQLQPDTKMEAFKEWNHNKTKTLFLSTEIGLRKGSGQRERQLLDPGHWANKHNHPKGKKRNVPEFLIPIKWLLGLGHFCEVGESYFFPYLGKKKKKVGLTYICFFSRVGKAATFKKRLWAVNPDLIKLRLQEKNL